MVTANILWMCKDLPVFTVMQISRKIPIVQNPQLIHLPLWQGVIKAEVKSILRAVSSYSRPLAIVQKNWVKDRTSRPCWHSDANPAGVPVSLGQLQGELCR